jgi:hypothetical protein
VPVVSRFWTEVFEPEGSVEVYNWEMRGLARVPLRVAEAGMGRQG